jgi:hypothetical protein
MLWQNDNGTPAIWLMNGLNPIGAATVGPNLQIDRGSERRWRGFATNWPK